MTRLSRDPRPLRPAERATIGEIMTRKLVTVPPDMGVDTLVAMLLERGLSRVPVVDDQGRLVGIVATTDVVKDAHLRGDTLEAEQVITATPARARDDVPTGFHLHTPAATVADIMTRTVVTLPETASIAEAARLLAAQHLHGIAVTSDARLVGILSTSDIVAWVAGM